MFFHKYFSRKNHRKPTKPGAADGDESDKAVGDNDESNDEETHSDIAESVPDSDDANSEQEGDEEDGSDIEEAAVWKVRRRLFLQLFKSYRHH